MSDEPFFTDPAFGDFIVSANGFYDHEAGLWWKPWTNKPERAVIGYVCHTQPGEEVVAYSYLVVDVSAGVLRWYHGMFGNPELDQLVGVVTYRG